MLPLSTVQYAVDNLKQRFLIIKLVQTYFKRKHHNPSSVKLLFLVAFVECVQIRDCRTTSHV